MKNTNYSDKLKNPKWQRKRLEILNLRGFKCELCSCETKELHVHHRFYLKGREVWEYDNDVFKVLCCDCHEKEHAKKTKQVEVIPEKYKNLLKILEPNIDENLEHLCSVLCDFRKYGLTEILKDMRTVFVSEQEPDYLISTIRLLSSVVDEKSKLYFDLIESNPKYNG